ncbi:hypothetical protein [Dyadobacter crusticola]|uniref:hypothetical protein n=1 Tax=Dyadobacter crusticola TaxID=292407 RepID=UPI00068E108C|nr:hypothetical protein [Dyadobacter crusticola]
MEKQSDRREMDEYLILMRLDLLTKEAQPSPEQMQGFMEMYHNWVGDIAARKPVFRWKRLIYRRKSIEARRHSYQWAFC